MSYHYHFISFITSSFTHLSHVIVISFLDITKSFSHVILCHYHFISCYRQFISSYLFCRVASSSFLAGLTPKARHAGRGGTFVLVRYDSRCLHSFRPAARGSPPADIVTCVDLLGLRRRRGCRADRRVRDRRISLSPIANEAHVVTGYRPPPPLP